MAFKQSATYSLCFVYLCMCNADIVWLKHCCYRTQLIDLRQENTVFSLKAVLSYCEILHFVVSLQRQKVNKLFRLVNSISLR